MSRQGDLEAAVSELKITTLAGIRGQLARLIYCASTRDYNTGEYFHDGLAAKYSPQVAAHALMVCHQEVFRNLSYLSLESLVEEVENYVSSTRESSTAVLSAWKQIEPYRIIVPTRCESLASELFVSNVKVALAVLQARQPAVHGGQRSSSQRQ